MSHSHAHGEQENTYFLDQLCTIAAGGLLGFTAIMAYETGMLKRINLIERFHLPVLLAGIALVAMVVLRALAIWKQAGEARAKREAQDALDADHEHHHADGEACDHDHGHEHSHSHGHEHSHSHGHEHSHSHGHDHSHAHGHEHSHGGHDHEEEAHDHGWAPWRYAILIIPAVLFFLGLPTGGYNMTRLEEDLKDVSLDPGTMSRRAALANLAGGTVLASFKKSGRPVNLKFSELQVHASREKARDFFDGRTVILQGQFWAVPGKDREFSLFRVKINCCGADAITLKSRILLNPESPALQGFKTGDWVQIEGEISFQQVAGRNEWMPVIQLPLNGGLQRIEPPANPNDGV
jgi:hypothetical protein